MEARREHARSFDRVADAYRRARPSYPAAAVQWALERAPGRRVVDLAAGTGKLTEVILAAGADVTAVEPLANMRAALAESLPGVPAVDGTAEAIPLGDASADAVLVGQAFHWFDAPRALAEIARVLVPGGVLGLVWNARDDSVAWVAELTEALHGAGDVVSAAREIGSEPISGPHFAPSERREFTNPVAFDRARLVEWATSTSSIATLAPAQREAALARIGRLADEHPDLRGQVSFTMPYVTAVVRATRI
ncbi:MAG TPA: methyltransferase domain-containing protein [Gaiellales bacterium]